MEGEFWDYIDQLIETCPVTLDRPKGSTHPRYPGMIYPVDYGYLSEITASDGGGIDVWTGSQELKRAMGLICSVDLLKRDAEIKILLGCTEGEIQVILEFLSDHSMRVLLIRRK